MIYKNAILAYVKSCSNNGLVTGREIVQIYMETAKQNGRQISKSHVPFNAHKLAKKHAQLVGKCTTKKGQKSNIYLFNI